MKTYTKTKLMLIAKKLGLKGVSNYNKQQLNDAVESVAASIIIKWWRLCQSTNQSQLKRQENVEYDLYEYYVDTDDEEEEEKEEKEEKGVIELVTDDSGEEDGLVVYDFVNNNTYAVVLVYISDCEPCVELKSKFRELVHNTRILNGKEVDVKFAMVDIEKYEEKFGEIENNHIDVFPTVKFCKRGQVFKTSVNPTVNAMNKQIDDMIYCRSAKALYDECKYRGLKCSGNSKELGYRIVEDHKIGWNLQDKNIKELIEYIDTHNMKRPKKMTEMTDIQLRKHIRKESKKIDF